MADMLWQKTIPAIPKNTVSKSIFMYIVDTLGAPKTGLAFDTAGLLASYARQGAARVAITPVTLAALTTAWASGGFKEVDATNMPGVYRLDVPNAAFVSGSDNVEVVVWKTGTFYGAVSIPLENIDTVNTNTTRTDN